MIYFVFILFSWQVFAEGSFLPERPDAPDNALTISKNDFYWESEVLSHSVDKKKEKNSYLQTSLRYGITDKLEFLFSTANFATRSLGNFDIGDATPRLRVNHLGLDGSRFQLSTIYGANFPIGHSSETDWGTYFGIPFAIVFQDGWYFAATIAYIGKRNLRDKNVGQTLGNSFALFNTLTDNFDLFVQAFGSSRLNNAGDSDLYVGWGSAWRPFTNFQVDFFINYGETKSSVDRQYALGFAKKF